FFYHQWGWGGGAWQSLLSSSGARRGPWGGSWHGAALLMTNPSRGSSSPAQPQEGKKRSNKPLKEWTLIVSPFGQLKMRLPCHVTVRPLDPLRYPDADRVFVTVSGVDRNLHQGLDLDNIQVKYDESRKEMSIISDSMDSKASVDVKTPIKFDLDIRTSGSVCVKIEKIECDNCRIETETGTSILQSIKSVKIEKLQGTSINISTEDGLLKMKYLYAESSFLSSTAGDILLGSIHGNTTLQTKTGNITVDSLDGCLKASTHQGAIDVYISQGKKVDLKCQKGSITVKVPASLKAYLQLSGSKVDVSPEIQLQETQHTFKDGHITITGHMNQKNEREKWIKADTQNGAVQLQSQSWFQSVKLQVP
uniref:Family with sequence similarity 185 member A n=1 Tax=Sphenodon punctatus TaxID=8508 RepID=A0A8D0L7T2_SPHPU